MSSRSDEAIAEATALLRGRPVFLAGSCAAAQIYDKPHSFGDLDLFVPTQQVLIATIQTLLDHGYTMEDRYHRAWERWLRYGLRGWNTNSMKLSSRTDVMTNVVYKLVDGHPTTSLGQVLESFDLGLLAIGLNLENEQWYDMRRYLWPDEDPMDPKPLMPDKQRAWKQGLISQYNGTRQPGRYARYSWEYGYDLTRVKPDLVQGYRIVASYHLSKTDKDKVLLGQIFNKLGDLIEDDDFVQLLEAYKLIDFNDPLDEIMEKLE